MIYSLYEWTLSWVQSPYAAWGLFAIAFAESMIFPIPPDLLLIPLCLAFPDQAFLYAGLCTLGSVSGGGVGCALGRYGGRPLALRLFSEDRLNQAQRVYEKWGAWALVVSGFTPVPYKVFTILSGLMLIRWRILFLASLVGRGGRFFLVAALIVLFGEQVETLLQNHLNLLSIGVLVLVVLGFVSIRLFSLSSKKPGANA